MPPSAGLFREDALVLQSSFAEVTCFLYKSVTVHFSPENEVMMGSSQNETPSIPFCYTLNGNVAKDDRTF